MACKMKCKWGMSDCEEKLFPKPTVNTDLLIYTYISLHQISLIWLSRKGLYIHTAAMKDKKHDFRQSWAWKGTLGV